MKNKDSEPAPLKILFVSIANTIGGAEISLLYLIKYLSRYGHQLFMAMPPSTNKSYEKLLSPYLTGILFVKPMNWKSPNPANGFWSNFKQFIYTSYKSGGWHFKPTFKILHFIKKNKIDIVHTNTIMALDGAFAAKLAGVSHFHHVREAIGINQFSLARFPLMSNPNLFRSLMDKLQSRVIVNSDFTKGICTKYFPEQKIIRIYNPLEKDFFTTEPIQRIRDNKTKAVVGLVANVTSRIKNHSTLR